MKLTLNLTYEEGMKVLEAMRDAAAESGWEEDELDECGVIKEYANVVDAALTAMGIEVCIAKTPSDENHDEAEEVDEFDVPVDYESDFDEEENEDEDEDEDEEDEIDTTAYSLTVKGEFALRYMKAGHTFEEACEIADLLFPSNPQPQPQPDAIERLIVERDGKRCLTETNATVLLRIIGDTVQERMEDDTQQERAEMIKKIFVKIAENYRIEEIIMGE